MSVGIVYLLGHPQLAGRLVVSLYTLRQWYSGPVTVFTSRASSHVFGRCLAGESRLGVDHCQTDELPDKNAFTASYLTKVAFIRASPYRKTVYLDADTVVAGDISELIESARHAPLTVTAYGSDATSESHIRPLLESWIEPLEGIARNREWRRLLQRTMEFAYPRINGGVLAIDRDSPVFDEWKELTLVGRETPIPDEIALQLLTLKHPHQLLGCHLNCIPQVNPWMGCARIWHFAGASHLQFDNCRAIWLPKYRECIRLNIADIRRWAHVRWRRRTNTRIEYWRSPAYEWAERKSA